jgi:hypothetical protein
MRGESAGAVIRAIRISDDNLAVRAGVNGDVHCELENKP